MVAREVEGRREAARWTAAIALALGAAALYTIRLDRPGFFDNEGRYAEVAREMLLRRDFVTPEMDFTLFLNKPPLTYWITAGAFALGGLNEWARLSVVAMAAATLVAVCRIGARLFAEGTGLLAGLVLASMLGFVLEARTMRPDSVLVLSVAGAVACWLAAEAAVEPARRRWLVAMYALLGIGVMAKGLVPVLLAAVPIGLATLRDHGLAGVRRVRPLLGAGVLAAIVLPWHVAVSLRHPGFAWDYVVNQHLLFFLDKKFPRDSVGDPLLSFWGAFFFRAFPWVLLVPLALGEGWRGRRRDASSAEHASFFCWTWLAGVIGFFSLAPSRLEHYSLPALAPTALLAARAVALLAAGALGRVTWWWLGGVGAVVLLAGGLGVAAGRDLLLRVYWLAQQPRFVDLVMPAACAAVAGGLVLVAAAAGRRAAGVVAGFLTLGAPLAAVVVAALVMAEPIFSWKPAGDLIRSQVAPDVEVVFESPEEYQLVGGLAFYAGRRITLLEVPGFVAPTYLEPHVAGMFLSRTDLTRRWTSGERLVLVSDPQRRRESPDEIVPPPHHVLGRFGDRWILSTVPAAELS